jgi:transcriptional repressor NrdR
MKCPACAQPETRVIDSRATDDDEAIRRRRECLGCGQRFTTYERREETPLMVVKKGGVREPFDRDKLLRGLARATAKREISMGQIEALVDDLEAELRNDFHYEVLSHQVGEMVLRRLRDLDKVAYVRFASVYREFQDVDEFLEELNRLQ